MQKLMLMLMLMVLLLMVTAMVPALAENTEKDPMTGAWEMNTEDPAVLPQEVQDAFEKATAELTGCVYEPMALLASQVVAGMNYCLLCRCTVVTPDAPGSYVLMYVYSALDGTAEILSIQDVVIGV